MRLKIALFPLIFDHNFKHEKAQKHNCLHIFTNLTKLKLTAGRILRSDVWSYMHRKYSNLCYCFAKEKRNKINKLETCPYISSDTVKVRDGGCRREWHFPCLYENKENRRKNTILSVLAIMEKQLCLFRRPQSNLKLIWI